MLAGQQLQLSSLGPKGASLGPVAFWGTFYAWPQAVGSVVIPRKITDIVRDWGHFEVNSPGVSQASAPLLLLPRTCWVASRKCGPSGLSCPISILRATLVGFQDVGVGQGFPVMTTAGWGCPLWCGPNGLGPCIVRGPLSGKVYDLCVQLDKQAWRLHHMPCVLCAHG